jgi:alkanesulfonate monooxygenase SsuD/methylene tetrahydromethanopterin reductase-like flavin-dependent oxidoreductase (luciferase family)
VGESASPLRFCIDLSNSLWSGNRTPAEGVARLVDLARHADEAGYDSVWASEDPDSWDAFSVLSALSRETSRIRLGPGVANPFHRHPNLIAASVATLDRLSLGRAFLGLGRGQPEWYERSLGIKVGSPLAVLEETFDLLAQWWGPSHRASAPGPIPVSNWERRVHPVQQAPPIYLAAVGPKALALAGRRAHGVLFNELASMTFMQKAIGTARAAAAKAGRDPAELSFFARVGVIITDHPEPILEQRKNTIAMIHALPGMERLTESPDFDTVQIVADVRRLMRTNDVLARGGAFAELRRMGDLEAARAVIPTELVAGLTVVGPLPYVRQRLTRYRDIGITHVFVSAADAPDARWTALPNEFHIR